MHLTGNIGEAVIKTSAVDKKRHVIEAPCVVFECEEDVKTAFKRGDLDSDVVVVVRGQGPQANGMPELHGLTPSLSILQDKGFRVALVTDGRMSGASGKVPAAIHVSPEAKAGGVIGKIQTGDMIRLDAVAGELLVRVEQSVLEARTAAAVPEPQRPGTLGSFIIFNTPASGRSRHIRWWSTVTSGGVMHPVLKEALERSPVMPVLVIPEISMAAPLAEALASGGLTVFEITLRTECALDAMIAMKKAVPHALIGAGTVTNTRRMSDAKEYGADFVVSPGTTCELWAASEVNQIPVLQDFRQHLKL